MAEALDSVLPGLSSRLRRATAEDQRSAGLASARMALLRTGVRDPRINAADAATSEGRFGASPEREALVPLIDALDSAAWRVQDKVHQGDATEEAYVRAFREARAVAALVSAIGEGPFESAIDGIYEAYHAIGDTQALGALLDRLLIG